VFVVCELKACIYWNGIDSVIATNARLFKVELFVLTQWKEAIGCMLAAKMQRNISRCANSNYLHFIL